MKSLADKINYFFSFDAFKCRKNKSSLSSQKTSHGEYPKKISCQDSNIVYLIECNKDRCKKHYIGFTTKTFRERMLKHLGYVWNKTISKSTGEHFNLPGHNREKLHIRKFNTFYAGINREP